MLEKVTEFAERAATNVSRRQFLGRFGKGALTAAGALGAILTLRRNASAGRRERRCPPGYKACGYDRRSGDYQCCRAGKGKGQNNN